MILNNQEVHDTLHRKYLELSKLNPDAMTGKEQDTFDLIQSSDVMEEDVDEAIFNRERALEEGNLSHTEYLDKCFTKTEMVRYAQKFGYKTAKQISSFLSNNGKNLDIRYVSKLISKMKAESRDIDHSERTDKHVKTLAEFKNLSEQVRYAIYQKKNESPTVLFNFLITNGVNTTLNSVEHEMGDIRAASRVIENYFRDQEHVNALRTLKNNEEKVKYAQFFGCERLNDIYDFLRVNENEIKYSIVRSTLSRLNLISEEIDICLKSEQHTKKLATFTNPFDKVKYAWENGYKKYPMIYKFLKINDQTITPSIIKYSIIDIRAKEQNIDYSLRSKKHIDALAELKHDDTKVKYAMSNGCNGNIEVRKFLVANGQGEVHGFTLIRTVRQIKATEKRSRFSNRSTKQDKYTEILPSRVDTERHYGHKTDNLRSAIEQKDIQGQNLYNSFQFNGSNMELSTIGKFIEFYADNIDDIKQNNTQVAKQQDIFTEYPGQSKNFQFHSELLLDRNDDSYEVSSSQFIDTFDYLEESLWSTLQDSFNSPETHIDYRSQGTIADVSICPEDNDLEPLNCVANINTSMLKHTEEVSKDDKFDEFEEFVNGTLRGRWAISPKKGEQGKKL